MSRTARLKTSCVKGGTHSFVLPVEVLASGVILQYDEMWNRKYDLRESFMMEVAISLPDEIVQHLKEKHADVPRYVQRIRTRLLYFAIAGVHVILSGPLPPPA